MRPSQPFPQGSRWALSPSSRRQSRPGACTAFRPTPHRRPPERAAQSPRLRP
ncbi:hypothetical protein BC567DRAFT_216992 [Phyllosticta citribraziliensis]